MLQFTVNTDLALLLKVLNALLLQQGKSHVDCYHCCCKLTSGPAALQTIQNMSDAAVILMLLIMLMWMHAADNVVQCHV
jgi:hypothetical protein